VIEKMLAEGENLNRADHLGVTPLMWAAFKGKIMGYVEFMSDVK
jgi:ankyrin repeat protein